MVDQAADIPDLVYKPVSRDDLTQYSLDGRMLKVLMELDGRKTLLEVARLLDMELGTLHSIVSQLLSSGLIERDESFRKILDREFFIFLVSRLNQAVGPIAETLVEDVLEEMGLRIGAVPIRRATELVDLLCLQIPRQQNATAFREAMIDRIENEAS